MITLSDVTEFVRNGASIKQEKDCGGIPITRIETISNSKFNYDRLGYADIFNDKYSDYYLKDNDVLLSHINSEKYLGRAVIYKKNDDQPIIHGMNLLCLRFHCDKYNPEYFCYYSQSDKAKMYIANNTKKSVNQASITATAIKNMPIPNASLDSQSSVVFKLNKLQKIIDSNNLQLIILDELVKSRFVEMFGDPIKNSFLLPIVSLETLGKWNSGGTPSRSNPEYFNGDVNWYSAGELNSLYLYDSNEKLTKDAIEESSAKLFKSGSMLIGMYDTAAFKMGILTMDSSSNQACACIEPNGKINIVWLYYELQIMKDHFLSQRRGVRQKNLNLGMIKSFKIPLADIEKQNQFACFVVQIEKTKSVVKQSIEKLETLKKSLMQEYFG